MKSARKFLIAATRPSTFIGVVCSLITLTALMKIFTALAVPDMGQSFDPILWMFPSEREALLFAASAELFVVYLLTSKLQAILHKFGVIFVLACTFMSYRLSNIIFYNKFGCSCAGSFPMSSSGLAVALELILFSSVVYMLVGSYIGLRSNEPIHAQKNFSANDQGT